MKYGRLISKDFHSQGFDLSSMKTFSFRRTGVENSSLLNVVDDQHSFPPLVFSRVKSYTVSSEHPLK